MAANRHADDQAGVRHARREEQVMYIGVGTLVLILAVVVVVLLMRGRRV